MKKVAKMEAFLCPLSLKRLHCKRKGNIDLNNNNNSNCFASLNQANTDDNNNIKHNANGHMQSSTRYPFDTLCGHEYNNDLISISTENTSTPNSPKINGPSQLKMVMLNDFHGQGDNQVSVKMGEIILVLSSDPNRPEWTFIAFNKGRQEGYVPTNFLRPLFPGEEESNGKTKPINNKLNRDHNIIEHPQAETQANMKNELKEIASKLNLTSGKHKKCSATVKPISAQDQHTLDSAISLAKELASKSMLELGDSSSNHDDSPRTPTSPDKKKTFHFRFKSFCKNFSEVSANIPDVQSSITKEAKLAYDSLIEKGMLNNHRNNHSNMSQQQASPDCRYNNNAAETADLMDLNPPMQAQPSSSTDTNHFSNYYNQINIINPLPLPPRPQGLSRLQAPPTRLQRREAPR